MDCNECVYYFNISLFLYTGVVNKLDYLRSIGVKAVWLSPFFQSPMDDMGYDISDYRKVDPTFGDLNVFDDMVKGAHERGQFVHLFDGWFFFLFYRQILLYEHSLPL